jgi:energy-coupling factor transporter ATP-binding protein EcfA2
VEELIAILEEYLGQEYTERWAYELATLYQQADQMQKCLAACDDLVLWFHSGKYVKKALELKRRYAALTPKQQQIYEECLQEKQQALSKPVTEETVIQNVGRTDGDVLAESIMAQTEKEIADQITAHKAEMDKEADTMAARAASAEEIRIAEEVQSRGSALNAEELGTDGSGTQSSAAPAEADVQPTAAGIASGVQPAAAGIASGVQPAAAGTASDIQPAAAGLTSGAQAVPQSSRTDNQPKDAEELQAELARSMRKIISGVVRRVEEHEEDIPASVEPRIQNIQKIQVPPQPEPVAGKLSIDDILLSMGDQGQKVADAIIGDDTQDAPEENQDTSARKKPWSGMTVMEVETDGLTDMEREALQYTSHPERLLRNKKSLPSYAEETPAEDLGNTRRVNTKEELLEASRRDILSEKTIRIPSREINRGLAGQNPADLRYADTAQNVGYQQTAANTIENKQAQKAEAVPAAYAEPEPTSAEPIPAGAEPIFADSAVAEPEASVNTAETAEPEAYTGTSTAAEPEQVSAEPTSVEPEPISAEAEQASAEPATPVDATPAEAPEMEQAEETDEAYEEDYEDYYEEEYLTIPEHLRGLFSGFTEVDGLEDQIANAIIQAEAKGDDRTSRTGNILIFGAHGSGKTTLAMNIAKAIARDKGNQTMKIAKIYAADLNRKDIAATVARIAGGTLIIEEAGDLEAGTIEQLTTAMEFRTDGLIVILEDEQQYIHELLMQHPRFTMKFTAQIYIPAYTAEELATFGQICANAQDFVLGEDAYEILRGKIETAQQSGTAVSITDVTEMVNRAIARSNKFFRKISMGKKRYDENDYVVLFPKDMK